MLHCFLFLLFLNSDWSNYVTFRCNHLARGDYTRDTKFENVLSQKKKKNIKVLTFCQCKGGRRFRKFNSEELKSNDIWLLSLTCFFFSQVDLPGTVLHNMSAMLDLDASQDAFDASVATIADKTPRYKKYLGRVCNDIRDLKVSKKEPVVFVYSVKDEMFKIFF